MPTRAFEKVCIFLGVSQAASALRAVSVLGNHPRRSQALPPTDLEEEGTLHPTHRAQLMRDLS